MDSVEDIIGGIPSSAMTSSMTNRKIMENNRKLEALRDACVEAVCNTFRWLYRDTVRATLKEPNSVLRKFQEGLRGSSKWAIPKDVTARVPEADFRSVRRTLTSCKGRSFSTVARTATLLQDCCLRASRALYNRTELFFYEKDTQKDLVAHNTAMIETIVRIAIVPAVDAINDDEKRYLVAGAAAPPGAPLVISGGGDPSPSENDDDEDDDEDEKEDADEEEDEDDDDEDEKEDADEEEDEDDDDDGSRGGSIASESDQRYVDELLQEVCDDDRIAPGGGAAAAAAAAAVEEEEAAAEVRSVMITTTKGGGKKGGKSPEEATTPPPPPSPLLHASVAVEAPPVMVRIASSSTGGGGTASLKKSAVGDSLKKRLASSLRNKLSDSFL